MMYDLYVVAGNLLMLGALIFALGLAAGAAIVMFLGSEMVDHAKFFQKLHCESAKRMADLVADVAQQDAARDLRKKEFADMIARDMILDDLEDADIDDLIDGLDDEDDGIEYVDEDEDDQPSTVKFNGGKL
jgi:hypothetical protein